MKQRRLRWIKEIKSGKYDNKTTLEKWKTNSATFPILPWFTYIRPIRPATLRQQGWCSSNLYWQPEGRLRKGRANGAAEITIRSIETRHLLIQNYFPFIFPFIPSSTHTIYQHGHFSHSPTTRRPTAPFRMSLMGSHPATTVVVGTTKPLLKISESGRQHQSPLAHLGGVDWTLNRCAYIYGGVGGRKAHLFRVPEIHFGLRGNDIYKFVKFCPHKCLFGIFESHWIHYRVPQMKFTIPDRHTLFPPWTTRPLSTNWIRHRARHQQPSSSV